MRPGRELDTQVAELVFGHGVFIKEAAFYERTPLGDRPLRCYSQDIAHAWGVAERMAISILPIEEGQWFAMVGPKQGWRSPAEFIEVLQSGDFARSGAALGDSAPYVICLAALRAAEKRSTVHLDEAI